MTRYTLKGLAARRLRVAGTVLAVLLGVALAAGTYVLTDTINRSFDDLFSEALKGTDLVVSPKEVVRQEGSVPPAFDASLLDQVRATDGVKRAEGGIFSFVKIVDERGKGVGSKFSPNFAASTIPEPFETRTYSKGRPPRDAREAGLDAATAKRKKLELGDSIGVVGETRITRYRIVGLTELGETSSGGASSVALTLPEAQRVTDKRGKLDQISIAATEGTDPSQLKAVLSRKLPRNVRVETGAENADRQTTEIGDDLGFMKIALLVFSGVSLVVGGFLIFNTFSITIAQRIREFGLLRTLGTSRRQVLRSVLLEALVIGGIGSLLGLGGGVLFASAINGLFERFGVDLPNTGTVIAGRTVLVSLLLGVGMTTIAALTPALRATRVTPMAALREAELPEGHGRGRLTAGLAVALGVGGLAMLCAGLFGGIESSGSAAGLMGGGAAAVLFAVSLYSPRLVRPLASLAGLPIERLRGLTGRLARENAMRKPGRTAVTAAALMIGLALVTFVTVFAAGISSSVGDAIDRNIQGDLIVQNTDGYSPIPARLAEDVRGVDGVASVSTLRFSSGKTRGMRGEQRIAGVDPAAVTDILSLDWKEGSDDTIRELRDDQAVIDQAWGESKGVDVGDRLSVLTPTGARASFEVVGSVKDNADLLGHYVVTQHALERDFGERRDTGTYARLEEGADSEAVERAVTRLVQRRYPSAEALNQAELKDTQESQINQLLGLVYALLSLAVIVSIFGIVNTLALSIHERTRELGMLRAIGMSRRQVRRVVRYEAVITALIGAILGSLLGVLFATLVSRPLADEGFSLSFPVLTLLMLLVLAGLAGVVAAIGPARRAARLDVLEALAYE